MFGELNAAVNGGWRVLAPPVGVMQTDLVLKIFIGVQRKDGLMNTNKKIERVYPSELKKGDIILIQPACYDDLPEFEFTISQIQDDANKGWLIVRSNAENSAAWCLDKDELIERVVLE